MRENEAGVGTVEQEGMMTRTTTTTTQEVNLLSPDVIVMFTRPFDQGRATAGEDAVSQKR